MMMMMMMILCAVEKYQPSCNIANDIPCSSLVEAKFSMCNFLVCNLLLELICLFVCWILQWDSRRSFSPSLLMAP